MFDRIKHLHLSVGVDPSAVAYNSPARPCYMLPANCLLHFPFTCPGKRREWDFRTSPPGMNLSPNLLLIKSNRPIPALQSDLEVDSWRTAEGVRKKSWQVSSITPSSRFFGPISQHENGTKKTQTCSENTMSVRNPGTETSIKVFLLLVLVVWSTVNIYQHHLQVWWITLPCWLLGRNYSGITLEHRRLSSSVDNLWTIVTL